MCFTMEGKCEIVGITTEDSFIAYILYVPRCLLGETVDGYIDTKRGLSFGALRNERGVNRME